MKNEWVSFRKANLTDLPFLLRLRMETLESHLVSQDINLTNEEHEKRILNSYDDAMVVVRLAEDIGFLKFKKYQRAYKILQLQICGNYQRRGIGTFVLRGLIRKANEERVLLKLSVLKGNQAMHFYEKLGFITVNEGKKSIFMEKDFDRSD